MTAVIAGNRITAQKPGDKRIIMTAPSPRPGIMDIAPYVGGESRIDGKSRIIKLSSNEGAFGPSPKAMEAYLALAGELHRYPDGGATELRRALAEQYGLDAERIVCGSGSDEILSLLCSAYAGPGDEVLHSAHGFLMYAISARAAGATPVAAPETNLTADVDALLAHVTDKTRIVFLANPNNPTGTYLPRTEIERLWKGLPENTLLVLDAAYAEFVTDDDYTAGNDLVDQAGNVVMTRTFSKIHALGGLRLGWGYFPAEIAGVVNRVRGPFNVNAAALAAGVAALEDTAFTEMVREENAKIRDWTVESLKALGNHGIEITDSVGNFILVRLPQEKGRDAEACDGFLKNYGIIIRRMAGYGLPDCLRVSIGRMDEMRTFVHAMGEFLNGAEVEQ